MSRFSKQSFWATMPRPELLLKSDTVMSVIQRYSGTGKGTGLEPRIVRQTNIYRLFENVKRTVSIRVCKTAGSYDSASC